MAVTPQEQSHSVLSTQYSVHPVRRFFRRYGWGYAFVLPSMLVFVLFRLVPVVFSFLISLQNFRLNGDSTWVGLRNYADAFTTQSGVFVEALKNTLSYTVF